MVTSALAGVFLLFAPKLFAKPSTIQPGVSATTLGESTSAAARRESLAAAANKHYAALHSSLHAAINASDHRTVVELSTELLHAATKREAKEFSAHLSPRDLLLKLTAAQRVTLAMEIFDVGTDGTAWLSVLAQYEAKACGEGSEALGVLASVLLVVFMVALMMQAGRWLYLRREFSRPQLKKARNLNLAIFAVIIGVIEDIPQAVVTLMVASGNCARL